MLQTYITLTFVLFFHVLLALLSTSKNVKCTAWNTAKILYFNRIVERKNNQLSQEKCRWAFCGHLVKSQQYAISRPDALPEKEDPSSNFRTKFIPSTFYPITQQGTSFLIHKGRSTKMIRRSPAIQGGALCKGWTEATTQAFDSAIQSLGKNFISLYEMVTRNSVFFLVGIAGVLDCSATC
jgi:hypothetical protein